MGNLGWYVEIESETKLAVQNIPGIEDDTNNEFEMEAYQKNQNSTEKREEASSKFVFQMESGVFDANGKLPKVKGLEILLYLLNNNNLLKEFINNYRSGSKLLG